MNYTWSKYCLVDVTETQDLSDISRSVKAAEDQGEVLFAGIAQLEIRCQVTNPGCTGSVFALPGLLFPGVVDGADQGRPPGYFTK